MLTEDQVWLLHKATPFAHDGELRTGILATAGAAQ